MIMIEANPTCGVKIDAAIVAEPFRMEIRERVQTLKEQGIEAPLLVGLLANDDPAAKQYAEWTGRACRADGIRYEIRTIEDPIYVEQALQLANDDPNVHGIIVYYPIFGLTKESYSGTSQDDYIRDTVSYICDVEGLCHLYRSNLYRNIRYLDPPNNTIQCILPCTALSVVKLLEACPNVYNIINNNSNSALSTKHSLSSASTTKSVRPNTIVTIINRSEIVGRPLAAMLANDGAIVYSVDLHSIYKFSKDATAPGSGSSSSSNTKTGTSGTIQPCETETVEDCVRKSSIVITGVPSKAYRLPTEWIQPGTIVINVASYKNVDETVLLQIPGVIYIPQVGKVTVAMLERNVMRLFEQFHHPNVTCTRQQKYRRQFNNADHNNNSSHLLNVQNCVTYNNNNNNNDSSDDEVSSSWVDTVMKRGTFLLTIYTAVAITAIVVMQVSKQQKA